MERLSAAVSCPSPELSVTENVGADLIDIPGFWDPPTFGGNPVCCSAAIATIKYMLENDIPGVCREKGKLLKAGLQQLAEKYPEVIQEVRV